MNETETSKEKKQSKEVKNTKKAFLFPHDLLTHYMYPHTKSRKFLRKKNINPPTTNNLTPLTPETQPPPTSSSKANC